MISSRPLRVLVIEDDPDTRANLSELLALDGHSTTESASVAEAMELAVWEQVDAIILDRRLPDGDAGQLIPTLRKYAPVCPIVVVTGYPDVDSAIEALRHGAYDYLLKPISPEALRASVRRIAERRHTIDQLRKQRDIAESLIETAQAIVLLLDPQGNIVRFNSFLGELVGLAPEQLLSKSWLDQLIPAADHHRLERLLEQMLHGAIIRDQSSRLKTNRGTERLISWSGKALDGEDRVTGILLVGHDVTVLNEAQQRLVQSERLAAIGQMITGLAHESRNAFQRSQACLETLALEVEDRPSAIQLIQRIQRAQDHLHHLYEEVRMYAAPIHLDRQACHLEPIWRETWRNIQPIWEPKRIKLVEKVSGALPTVQADPHALERIFRNLLENAVSACSPEGTITIVCDLVASAETNIPVKEIAIRVLDDGSGIDLSSRQRAFEPFFTTKTHGTGLGLPITKRLVEAHGGSIEFGWPEKGTEVQLRLPTTPVQVDPLLRI